MQDSGVTFKFLAHETPSLVFSSQTKREKLLTITLG